MTSRFCIVLGLIVAGCYTSPVVSTKPEARPTLAHRAPVVRQYCTSHEVPMVCDQPPPGEDMCIEQAEDTLSVRRVSPGTLAVTIELVQTNGHTCTFDEKLRHAKTSQPDSQRWTFSSSDEDSPCTLDLVEQGGHISISSNGCRDYCGVRATLDAQFDTASSCAATTVQ